MFCTFVSLSAIEVSMVHSWRAAASRVFNNRKLSKRFLYLCFFVAYEGALRLVAGEGLLFGLRAGRGATLHTAKMLQPVGALPQPDGYTSV